MNAPGCAQLLHILSLLACAAASPIAFGGGADLRPQFEQWGLARTTQGAQPPCPAFTVVGAIEFAVAKRQGHTPRLSVEFLNWALC